MPFNMPAGRVIFNRTSASTGPNNTVAQASGSTTVTASSSASAGTCQKGTCHEAAVGAGVGVPLGVALMAALAALWWVTRQHKRRQHSEGGFGHGGERNTAPNLASQTQKPELGGSRRNELDGANINEMGTSRE